MKLIQRIVTVLMVGLTFFLTPLSAVAIDNQIDVCYTINKKREKISIPQMYTFENVIRGQFDGMEMNNPNDLYIDSKGDVYIADTGNNRILKFNSTGEFLCSYDNAASGGLITPKGVTVDENNNMYIADSGNQRIVILDEHGNYISSQGKPESDLLSGLAVYEPTKIAIGANDTLNVLVGKEFMSIGKENEFLGYVGSADVGFSLKNMLVSMFASEHQKKLITKVQPDTYNNFTLDANGMIYAVSYGTSNQIKKITSVGDNIYPENDYGEYSLNVFNVEVRPNFSDIAVSREGIISVSELNAGRIYQYDRNGELLSVFGGQGSGEGQFLSISALDVDSRGNLYVLDSGYGNVQIFSPTQFNKSVVEATNLYEEGKYDSAYEKWLEVLQMHDSYPIALNTVGKILYKSKDYDKALDYYKLAENQAGYEKALAKVQHQWVSEHFLIVSLGIFIVAALSFLGIMRFRSYAYRMNHDLNYGTDTLKRKKKK